MFKQGDTVIYGTNGVCRIDGITQMDYTGEKKDYYVLKPVFNGRSTLFVPTDSETLTARMRPLITEAGIRALAKKFPSIEPLWIEDEDERKAKCNAVLTDNDRETALALIKAIRVHRDRQALIGKKLHVADERFLKDAEKLLREEASFVLDADYNRVLSFLEEKARAV
ncbi:MAG: CarD family transcriptional regulator [Clostridia bacterium]|nr:CarD family transcriptional regulator [Clostridia bacterium]